MNIYLVFFIQIYLTFALKTESKSKIKNPYTIILNNKKENEKNPTLNKNIAVRTIQRNNLILNEDNKIDKNLNKGTDFSFQYTNIKKFLEATGTIILAGLFDRSFFITTLMAIKYSKSIVLISASASLTFIGIIAVYLGITINKYIPLIWVESVAVCLFLVFGAHMIYDAFCLDGHSHTESLAKEISVDSEAEKNNENVINIKMPINNKIEENFDEKGRENLKCIIIENSNQSNEPNILTAKQIIIPNEETPFACANEKNLIQEEKTHQTEYENKENNQYILNSKKFNILNILFYNENLKVFMKVFILIFFSEIGDRSQISTIYLTTTFDKLVVLLGVVMSSIILSILAVFAGKTISNKISEKNLTMIAGVSFLLFGFGAFGMLLFGNDE